MIPEVGSQRGRCRDRRVRSFFSGSLGIVSFHIPHLPSLCTGGWPGIPRRQHSSDRIVLSKDILWAMTQSQVLTAAENAAMASHTGIPDVQSISSVIPVNSVIFSGTSIPSGFMRYCQVSASWDEKVPFTQAISMSRVSFLPASPVVSVSSARNEHRFFGFPPSCIIMH